MSMDDRPRACASLNHFVVSHARHASLDSMRHRNGATRWPRGRGYPTQPNPMPHKHTQPIPTQSDLAQFDPSQFSPIRPSRTRSNPTQRKPTSAQPHPNPTEATPTHPIHRILPRPSATRPNPIQSNRTVTWSRGRLVAGVVRSERAGHGRMFTSRGEL